MFQVPLAGMRISRIRSGARLLRKERRQDMKIVLMEPLGIGKNVLEVLSDKLTEQGHSFTAYDTLFLLFFI